MIHSVNDFVAGESYDIEDEEEARRFVVSGYATSDEQVDVTDEEREAITAKNQTVGV